MKKKVYHFSILEVIIATALFSVLIFSTTTIFFRYHKLFAQIEINKPYILEKNIFYKKMLEITSSLDPDSINKKKNSYPQAINFVFYNGFKQNPTFSGKLLGRIYKNLQNNLVLQVLEGQEKKESILLSNIKNFSYQITDDILTISLSQTNNTHLQYCFFLQKSKEHM